MGLISRTIPAWLIISIAMLTTTIYRIKTTFLGTFAAITTLIPTTIARITTSITIAKIIPTIILIAT